MKKGKIITNIFLVILLLGCSIGIYKQYPTIYDHAFASQREERLETYFARQTEAYNYVLSQQLAPHNNAYSQFVESDVNNQDIATYQDEYQSLVKELINDLKNTEKALSKDKDIVYFATDLTTHKTITNTQTNLKTIKNDKDIQSQYSYYYQITYDQDGNRTLDYFSADFNEHTEFSSHQDLTLYNNQGESIGGVSLSSLKNISIIYALNKNLSPHGELAEYLDSMNLNDTLSYTMPYLIITSLICFIITLCIPYRYLKDNRFLHTMARIKFGFLSIIWCTVTWFIFYGTYWISYMTLNNTFVTFCESIGLENHAQQISYIANIGGWFILLACMMFLAYLIKYIFHKGFKTYIKEDTILGWLWTHGYHLLNQILDFDFNDSINKAVLQIVLVNFIIVSILCFFFVAGPFFAIIYSVIIFLLLRNKFRDMKNDYQVLLKATQKLSSGDFNDEINEDIGIFNPLKEEFTHIKEGFEKAVNDEVKSQKMKTELISNVSHDLKTPLTSIITYVDLLKDENLSPEQRQEYIQILNRNSLRLKNLIDDLFEVSKASSGNIQLDKVDIDIIALIKQAQLECQDQLDAQALDIRTNFTDEKMICCLDSSKTYRIFENLFMNISKYALEHTRVYLEAFEDDQHITITFKNISRDEMHFNEKEIVERFVQGDTSRNTSGSGLGLAIVKSFTEIQGGQFKVELDGDLFKTILVFKK